MNGAFHYFVYVVSPNYCTWDTCEEFTVITTSKERAEVIAQDFFTEVQFPLNIRQICSCDATEEQVLTVSFYEP